MTYKQEREKWIDFFHCVMQTRFPHHKTTKKDIGLVFDEHLNGFTSDLMSMNTKLYTEYVQEYTYLKDVVAFHDKKGSYAGLRGKQQAGGL